MIRKISWFLLICPALCFFACSRTEPKIAYGSIRMVFYEEAGVRGERFSFFVLPEDDDGFEDLAELYLHHDREGLVWRLSPEDWLVFEFDGKTWVGSHSLAMAGDEALPRGQFRAVLVDKGGEKSERSFVYDAPEDSRYPFPFFSIENGRYRVESGYPEHYLICYDQGGNYLNTQPLIILDGTVEELNLSPDIRTVALWAEDDEYNTAALTVIVPLR